MAATPTVRLAVPAQASKGEVIEIKAMIRHEMESGYRRDEMGEQIPRDILKHFECLYNGERVFSAEFLPGIAANPFLSFFTTATESGTLEFIWIDQHDQRWSKTANLEVT